MRKQGILRMAAAGMMAVAMMAAAGAAKAQGSAAAAGSDTVLKPAEMEKLLPPSVYYRGQTANTQLRNSGGVKFADGFYVLATKVDTGGYATGVAEKYRLTSSPRFPSRWAEKTWRRASMAWALLGTTSLR